MKDVHTKSNKKKSAGKVSANNRAVRSAVPLRQSRRKPARKGDPDEQSKYKTPHPLPPYLQSLTLGCELPGLSDRRRAKFLRTDEERDVPALLDSLTKTLKDMPDLNMSFET